MRTYLNQLIFKAEQFNHFRKGDGEFYFCEEEGVLQSKSDIEKWFKEDCECETEEEIETALEEQHIYKSYNELREIYDCYDDYGWAIDYVEVGDKVVICIAQSC